MPSLPTVTSILHRTLFRFMKSSAISDGKRERERVWGGSSFISERLAAVQITPLGLVVLRLFPSLISFSYPNFDTGKRGETTDRGEEAVIRLFTYFRVLCLCPHNRR